MCILKLNKVLTIVCVLVWSVRAQEAEVKDAPCAISIQESTDLTLNCSRRNLGAIPVWPAGVHDFNKDGQVLITFYNNSITNVTQLPPLPGSRVAIIFKSNRIVEIEENAFGNVDRLFYLDLSNNYISGDVLRSEIFQGPYKNGVYDDIALETLNLGYNAIHSLDRYLFQHTPNLTRLYLNNNPLEILDHVTILAISSAVNLEVLDLSKTDIDSIPLDAFKTLTKLSQLDLSNNRLSMVPESLTFVGSSLQYLTFNKNPIVELNDDSFVGLSNLLELEVGESDYLEEVKRSTFSPLTSLRVLHLCHNRNLRYISHNAFRGMTEKWTLKEVHLDDNNLSELSTDLMPWARLEVLGMSGNNWLCNCDLADIVTKQGAGEKFRQGEVPYCAAPMRMSGYYVTNITMTYCPPLENSAKPKRGFSISALRPKHIIYSILGVASVAMVGMLLGLLVNTIKAIYKKQFKSQPIHYINLREDASFA